MTENTTKDKGETAPSPSAINVTLYPGDNIQSLKRLKDNSVDSIVTDPPYGLSQHSTEDITNALTAWASGKEYLVKKKGFMGKTWDSFVPGPELRREAYRVLKPGGHVLCFAGSRTDDLMGIALRLGGFEIRDKIMWIYGTGFPKSHNISKALDKAAGADRTEVVGRYQPPEMDKPWNLSQAADERTVEMFASSRNNLDILAPVTDAAKQWDGWGTNLKPAHEPIIVARKPLIGTVAANVLMHGTGGINVDGCRVAMSQGDAEYIAERIGGFNNTRSIGGDGILQGGETMDRTQYDATKGRFPANIIHDGSDEVEEAFAAFGERPGQLGKTSTADTSKTNAIYGKMKHDPVEHAPRNDAGTASRFFYSSKASKADRANSKHPTVKPIALMEYLVRLVTPPGGIVLDPFAGSGTTGAAAVNEGFNIILMEREAEYCADIANRFAAISAKNALVEFKTATPPEADKAA